MFALRRLEEVNQIQQKSQGEHLELLAQLMAAQRERNQAHAQEISAIRAQVSKLAEALTEDEPKPTLPLAKEKESEKVPPPARELGELEA